MKLTPVSHPAQIQQTGPTQAASDARERAISALLGNKPAAATPVAPNQVQAQETAVANPNNISPEEMTAVRPPSQPEQVSKPVDNLTKVEETNETPAKDPQLEQQFKDLARQERILRARAQKQAQELKSQQEALKAREAELQAKQQAYEQGWISKDKFKQDPLSVLEEAGVTYEELTQRLLNPLDTRVSSEIQALKNEIKALRAANDEAKVEAQKTQTEQYQAALKQIKQDVTDLVKQDPNTFEAIAKTNSIDDVVELIERTYQKDGIILSVDQAAQEVEDYLVEEGFKSLSRIEKIKKRLEVDGAKVTPKPQEKQQTQANNAETTQQSTTKTLTNAMGSTRKLSARERAIARASGFKGDF